MRKFALLVCVLLFATTAYAKSSKSKSKSKSTDPNKTVHVRTYTRKNGTVVQAYDRAAPGEGVPKSNSPRVDTAQVARDSNGRIKRSKEAKDQFQRQSPCPSTGKTNGACPGYVVDHVKPLACGGEDAPNNMQWQTTEDAKQKDKVERAGCAGR